MNTVTPESVGFSSARLTRIDAAMQRYIDQGQIAGIQALVARRGKLAYARCFGRWTSRRASRCSLTRCGASTR